MKKLTAMLLAFVMIFAFASCGDDDNDDVRTELVTGTDGEAVTDSEGGFVTEIVTESTSDDAETTLTTQEETTLEPVSAPSDDPSQWTDEQIVEFYKAAAVRSKTKVKSQQKMTLTEMVVNEGDGFLGKLVEMITPFLISALEDNSTEFDGITGGYEKLQLSDAQSVKAYKSGGYTVVEMTMKEQVDGAHGDQHSGTVGHAISVVGDMATVEKELPLFKIGFDEADISLHYKNPEVKVKINKDGIIEKGTWTYQVYIKIGNLFVGAKRLPFSATVDKGYGTVDYKITVGGGF